VGGLAAAALVLWATLRFLPAPPPGPGVPLTLAEDRAARVSALAYDVSFHVPAERSAPVLGRMRASFQLHDASRPLALDFSQAPDHIHVLAVNGRRLDARHESGHVVIPSGALQDGHNVVTVDFTAGDDSLNRNDDFMYTLFVPARASLALPCFDQPDLKARWKLSLDIPADWTAVANGADRARQPGAGGRTRISFAETPPLPTYLFAFAAGKFRVETATRDGRVMRMFHREGDAAKVARNRDAIFDLHARALAWLQDYTGIPYPFGKFDFVLIPAFQFGGMEHAGAIYYNANGLLLDESATQNQLLGRANVISHETSHMWFGDLVTMKWFNDVWMKEVFANFMAAKMVNPSFPDVNHELRFLFQNYPLAYDVDRTEGPNPIRQELGNLNEAGSLYGAVIYQKAPIVMRQLEQLIGPDTFRDGLRDYLTRYSLGNATWTDLIAILDDRTPADLAAWSHAWIEEAGRPVVQTDVEVAAGRIVRLSVRQHDVQRGRDLLWPQHVRLLLGGAAAPTAIDVTLDRPELEVTEAAQLRPPRWVLPIGGYGFFDLDPGTLDYISSSLDRLDDPIVRGSALVMLWEAMLEDRVAPGRVLDQLLAALPRESDELMTQQMLAEVGTLFWRFTAADNRPAIAPRLETILRAGLAQAPTARQKGAWFEALRRTTTTAEGVEWLAAVWRHDTTVPGLPLAEADEADLAADLAVREVGDVDRLLAGQLQRFKDADRKARFAFLLPALSRDPAVRDGFFNSLGDVGNRRHEAWVLDAVRYLNHPLRAAYSKKYVRPALALVEDIQRTGDIFFPKRWTDAALSGYQSVQTAAEVRAFIDQLPDTYPPRLRWVLLASADQLFRAARLLNQ
jgi:aminopeptidase N